jgi:hypothetical protein
MKGLLPVRPLNSLTNSLKFIIQPHDLETSDSLCGIGFQPIPAIPQLVYRLVPNTQVADVFGQICERLTETSQAASRFLLTRSPLEDSTLLVEFLQAQPRACHYPVRQERLVFSTADRAASLFQIPADFSPSIWPGSRP